MLPDILYDFASLVVDSDAKRAEGFCTFLRNVGIGSTDHCFAGTVEAAASKIDSEVPALVFLRHEGDEAATHTSLLRLKGTAPHIPLIILCEPDETAVALGLLMQDAQDFLTEPVEEIHLKKTILLALRNSKTAEALRKSNERYELVSKATNDMVWDWDLLHNRVFRSPEGWVKVFGVGNAGSESRLSDSWWDRVHPDDRDKSNSIIEQVLRDPTQEYFEIECRVLRNTGEYATVMDRGYIVRNPSGEVTRLIGATQNITERKLVEKRLDEERRERQNEITGAVIAAQEQEREAIGKELHDNINQILAATKLYIEYAISNEEKRDSLLKTAKEFVESAVKEIRNLTKSLAPASIGQQGLKAALEELLRTLKPVSSFTIQSNISIEDEKQLSEGLKLSVYRIMQEALTNISRHAAAKNVKLTVKQQGDSLSVVLHDDGTGFDLGEKHRGLGLRNMRSRAELFNGELVIDTQRGKGSTLSLHFNIVPQ